MQNQLTETEQIALEKYQKKKKQDALRQAKYYEKNKASILEKRKLANAKSKETLNSALQKLAIDTSNEENENIEENVELQIEEEKEEPNIQPTTKKSNYTAEEIINLLKNTEMNDGTRIVRISAIKRVFRETCCPDLKTCLTKYKQMIDTIEKSKKYKVNSQSATIQSLLFVFDKYNLLNNMYPKRKATQIKKAFLSSYEMLKDKSTIETAETQKNIVYPTADDYLARVKNKFGEQSKQFLISLLYLKYFTPRDNFYEMKIIETLADDNKKDNFFLRTRTKMVFILNNFKTKNKFERLEFTVPTGKLKVLLNWWVDTKKLKYGAYLFGKTPLSNFVSKMNKQLGYSDELKGVNAYRHIVISELPEANALNYKERKAMADQMAHGLMTQQKYRRNLKVD